MSPTPLPVSWRRSLRFVATLALASLAPAHAALKAIDDFNTYIPGPVTGLNGGNAESGNPSGWTGAWTGIADATVSDLPMEESTNTGVAARFKNRGQTLRISAASDNAATRALTPATGTAQERVRYLSFIFKVEKDIGSGSNVVPSDVFASLMALDGVSGTTNKTGVVLGGGKFGARVGGTDVYFDQGLVYNKSYLVVLRLGGWTGTRYGECRAWLDPVDATEGNNPSKVVTGSNGSTGFTGIGVRSFGAGFAGGAVQYAFDDLRVGDTWSDVYNSPSDVSFRVTTSHGWKGGYTHTLAVTPGGAFDYSPLVEPRPAGSTRRVHAPNGYFEFTDRPGERLRLAGVNLNYSAQFLDSDQAINDLADTLARSGYNAVRLHHFDGPLTDGKGLMNVDSNGVVGRGGDINTSQLTKIRKLFAALKQRGIFIAIDLYTARPIPNNGFFNQTGFTLGGSISANNFKALIPINTAALNDWKAFAYELLTHTDSHGPAWKDDDALIAICPVNEDNLYKHWDGHPDIKTRYETLLAGFGPRPDGLPETADQKRNRFLFETHKASDLELRNYLKNTLQVKAMITGTNYGGPAQGLVYQRHANTYDFVDGHIYYNHPDNSWPPLATHDKNLSADAAEMPRNAMPSRIFGKPFTITEWNACRPNRYRAQASVIMPAYSLLQDWDALFCFQYADKKDRLETGHHYGSFGVFADPIGLVTARTTSLIFQRSDFQAGERKIVWGVRKGHEFNNDGDGNPGGLTSSFFSRIGLISQVGMLPQANVGSPNNEPGAPFNAVVTDDSTATPAVPAGWFKSTNSIEAQLKSNGRLGNGGFASSTNTFTSDTGEIVLNRALGLTTALSDRSELFALPAFADSSGGTSGDFRRSLTGIVKSVLNENNAASVGVISLAHNKGLATTNRILVTHLSDALPQNAQFSSSSKIKLSSWGASETASPIPHLIAPARTHLTLDLPGSTWRAWALDITGKRVADVALTGTGDVKGLTLSTTDTSVPRLAYEIAREDFLAWPFTTTSRVQLSSAGWSAWGAKGAATVAINVGGNLTSTGNPRLLLLDSTDHDANTPTGQKGVVFGHSGQNNQLDRFVFTTTFEPFSTIMPVASTPVKITWKHAANNATGTKLRLLVRSQGKWYATHSEFLVSSPSNASSMSPVENRSLDLNGSSGLHTNAWRAVTTTSSGAPINVGTTQVTPPSKSIDGLGFYIATNGTANQVAFVDQVELTID